MKVISYYEGVTSWEVAWDELRPIAGVPNSAIVDVMRSHFDFEMVTPSQVSQQAGLFLPFFGQGKYKFRDELVSVNVLEFRPNMVYASCPHTDMSKDFLVEAISILVQELGFRLPVNDRKVTSRSTIIVDIGKEFKLLFPKWLELLEIYRDLKGESKDIIPYSLRFGSSSGESEDHEIVFEKRFGSTPDEGWIFSKMHLDTPSHEQFLMEVERVFA